MSQEEELLLSNLYRNSNRKSSEDISLLEHLVLACSHPHCLHQFCWGSPSISSLELNTSVLLAGLGIKYMVFVRVNYLISIWLWVFSVIFFKERISLGVF